MKKNVCQMEEQGLLSTHKVNKVNNGAGQRPTVNTASSDTDNPGKKIPSACIQQHGIHHTYIIHQAELAHDDWIVESQG